MSAAAPAAPPPAEPARPDDQGVASPPAQADHESGLPPAQPDHESGLPPAQPGDDASGTLSPEPPVSGPATGRWHLPRRHAGQGRGSSHESPGSHDSQGTGSQRPGPDPSPPGSGIVRLSTLPWDISEADDRSLPPWFRRAVVMVLILLIVMRMVVWGFGQLESFWYTLFFSFFIGLAMEPIVNRLAARGLRRGVATFLVMMGLLLGTVLFFAVFGNLLAEQLSQLIRSLPSMLTSIVDWINHRFGTSLNPYAILDSLGIATSDIAKYAANLGVGLLSLLGTAVGWVFSLFTIALFSFYFAADGPTFRRTVAGFMPPARQRTFLTVWDISTQKAGGYVISRGILALISTIFHAVAFLILDLPYWLPLAMWVGVVSQFIPTIGTYLAGALPIIIALVDGSPLSALVVLIVVTLYQQIENYLVAPRVTKSTLEIHPAVAFGSVIMGSQLFGITGALLAIPVVATIQAVVTVYGRRYDLVHEFDDLVDDSDAARTQAAVRAADYER